VIEQSRADLLRLALGGWLHQHRRWGLVPLLAVGLLLNTHFLAVGSGNFMMIAGGTGILFGTLLRIVCHSFAGARDPLDRVKRSALVMDGPYAITRNPVHLAEASIALGVAMMSRMPWFVLVTALATAAVMALIIEWEEEQLRVKFGSVFEEYCKIVPRWFSLRRFLHHDSYRMTRGRVRLMPAVRAESATLLIGLLSILAFLAKADLEYFFFPVFTP
jgi:protein-S-isoprenylcysteine O-methyltransferase Ste14